MNNRTKENMRTENKAIEYLRNLHFYSCTLKQKKKILELLGIDQKYKNSFDMVKFKPDQYFDETSLINESLVKRMTLVEVKSSSRNLAKNLEGYYFSLQEREEELARNEKVKMIFVFVVIPRNGNETFYQIRTFKQIMENVKSVRIQKNITLKRLDA